MLRASLTSCHRTAFSCLFAIALVAGPAHAQQNRKDAEVKLEKQKSELQSAEGKASSLERDLKALKQEREALNERLLETAALIQKSESRLTAIETRLDELKSQEQLVRGSLMQRRDQIAKLLSVLQRMGRNPPPVMMTHREDALAMVRSAMLLSSAFPGMSKQALELADRLNELVRVMTDIKQEGERLKAETQRLRDSRTRLSGLMVKKKTSLSARQAELRQVRSAAAEIARSVTSLRDLIAKIDETAETERQRAHNRKAALAIQDATRKGRLGTADPASPSRVPLQSDPGLVQEAAPQTAPRNPDQEVEVAVLAPSAAGFGRTSAGRIEPAIPFHLAKAKLPRPTSGKLVLNYAEKTEYGGKSKGIVFKTRHAAQITSPCDGWIVYAGPFRSYGQLLIINAGGGYHVLLAGMTRIDVQPGQFVLAAEPVGTMNEAPPTVKEISSDTSPVLYVEFRKDGRPIDPAPWWVPNPRG
ncbi:MAG: peptidoglycan DD-metalloendopeptidase family protein [Filomicrobium sp.]